MNNHYGINFNKMLEFDKDKDPSQPIPGLLLRPLPYPKWLPQRLGDLGNGDNKFIYKQIPQTWKELPFTQKKEHGQLLFSRDYNGLTPTPIMYNTENLMISLDIRSSNSLVAGSSSSSDPSAPDLTYSEQFLKSLEDANIIDINNQDRSVFRLILGGKCATGSPEDIVNPTTLESSNAFYCDLTDYNPTNIGPEPVFIKQWTNWVNQNKPIIAVARAAIRNTLNPIAIKELTGFANIIDTSAFDDTVNKKDSLLYSRLIQQTRIRFDTLMIPFYYFVEIDFRTKKASDKPGVPDTLEPSIILGFKPWDNDTDVYFEETRQYLDKEDCFGKLILSFYDINEADTDNNILINKKDKNNVVTTWTEQSKPLLENQSLEDNTKPFKLVLSYQFKTTGNKTFESYVKLKRTHFTVQPELNSKGHFGLMYRNLPTFNIGNLQIAQRSEADPFIACQPPKSKCKIYGISAQDNLAGAINLKRMIELQIEQTNRIFERLGLEFNIEGNIIQIEALNNPLVAAANPWRQLFAHEIGKQPNLWNYNALNPIHTPQNLINTNYIKFLFYDPTSQYTGLSWGSDLIVTPSGTVTTNNNANLPANFQLVVPGIDMAGTTLMEGYGYAIPIRTTVPHELAHAFGAVHVFVYTNNTDPKYLMTTATSDPQSGTYIDPGNFELMVNFINTKTLDKVNTVVAYKSP